LQLALVQPGFEHGHGCIFVAVLGFFVLALDHNTGRQVGDAYGGVGFVHMLPARASGTVHIDAQVAFLNADGYFLSGIRQHVNRGKRGVAFARRVKGRNANQAVNAFFIL
jgi:hypothetical protein